MKVCERCRAGFEPPRKRPQQRFCSQRCANITNHEVWLRTKPYPTIEQRIAQRSVPGPNGCVLWTGSLSTRSDGYEGGYAILGFGGRNHYVHRLVWERKHGPIPSGMQVCHHCDVRSCINEDHLFLGTAQDNTDDRVAKGRATLPKGVIVGVKNPKAKLDEASVRVIRHFRLAGVTGPLLGRVFGVTSTQVYIIAQGKQWSHLEPLCLSKS